MKTPSIAIKNQSFETPSQKLALKKSLSLGMPNQNQEEQIS